ncbi:hypothetical protein C8Q77DRAFT_579425 [Trametes polyzona]|nr:hypothetical protein C8Q77DRAFT_579425 [Trametes polyzona]
MFILFLPPPRRPRHPTSHLPPLYSRYLPGNWLIDTDILPSLHWTTRRQPPLAHSLATILAPLVFARLSPSSFCLCCLLYSLRHLAACAAHSASLPPLDSVQPLRALPLAHAARSGWCSNPPALTASPCTQGPMFSPPLCPTTTAEPGGAQQSNLIEGAQVRRRAPLFLLHHALESIAHTLELVATATRPASELDAGELATRTNGRRTTTTLTTGHHLRRMRSSPRPGRRPPSVLSSPYSSAASLFSITTASTAPTSAASSRRSSIAVSSPSKHTSLFFPLPHHSLLYSHSYTDTTFF